MNQHIQTMTDAHVKAMNDELEALRRENAALRENDPIVIADKLIERMRTFKVTPEDVVSVEDESGTYTGPWECIDAEAIVAASWSRLIRLVHQDVHTIRLADESEGVQ